MPAKRNGESQARVLATLMGPKPGMVSSRALVFGPFYPLVKQGEQLAQTGRINGQVLFKGYTLIASAQGNTYFVFCGIDAEE